MTAILSPENEIGLGLLLAKSSHSEDRAFFSSPPLGKKRSSALAEITNQNMETEDCASSSSFMGNNYSTSSSNEAFALENEFKRIKNDNAFLSAILDTSREQPNHGIENQSPQNFSPYSSPLSVQQHQSLNQFQEKRLRYNRDSSSGLPSSSNNGGKSNNHRNSSSNSEDSINVNNIRNNPFDLSSIALRLTPRSFLEAPEVRPAPSPSIMPPTAANGGAASVTDLGCNPFFMRQMYEAQLASLRAEMHQSAAEKDNAIQRLRIQNEKVIEENKILKRAVTIQEGRMKHAQGQIQDSSTRLANSSDENSRLTNLLQQAIVQLQEMDKRIRELTEQNSVSRRFSGSSDFDFIVPRPPPDVF